MKSSLAHRCIALAVLALLAAGCTARGDKQMNDSIERYHAALDSFPGRTESIEQGMARFKETFADLTHPDTATRMAALYADELFFNDTLHTFVDGASVARYMGRTGASLSSSEVIVKQVIKDEADVFIRWTMDFRTRAAGRDIHSYSIGMTHLRFDKDGRVVLHQDFWDSGHALYAHIPVVGFAVRRARARM